MAGLPSEIFVVVAERDGADDGKAIAFETDCLDLESALEFKRRIGNKYGKKAVYKAQLINTDYVEKEKYGDVK